MVIPAVVAGVAGVILAIKLLVDIHRKKHTPQAPEPSPQAPMSPEQVDAVLGEAAAAHAEKNLDWKHSVVDLLKVLGKDSSLSARKKLADDIGYVGAVDGSAESNTKFHAELMREVARRWIEVPSANQQ